MVRMGFHERWISLIMECISTVSYSFLINGEPTGHITLTRGSPPRASLLECQKIQEILATYEKASGQQLNRAKTTLFFSRNTPQAMQEGLKDILGVEKCLSRQWYKLSLTYTMNCFKLPVTLCKEIEEASAKAKGSFAWRSILKAKDLIKFGLSWRVGDRTKIPIKGSNWLIDEGHRRVLSPLTNVPMDTRVAELIHGSPPTWNVNKACPIVTLIWDSALDFSELWNSVPMSFRDLVRKVVHSASDLLLEKFAVTCWLLWHKHNHDRLNLPSEDYSQTRNRAQAYLHEYLSVTTEEKAKKPKPPPVRWKLPLTNYYKVNFDGAIFKESNAGGIGVVIRDNAGMVIATLSQKVHGTHTVEMIEALAAKRAIIFAKEVGVADVEFEGDAENVIRDLSSNDPIHTPYGLVLEDATAMLQEFQRFSMSHTRRSGNTVAHALARRASECNSSLIWMEEVPPDITHVLLNDFFALN
uniref:RNase H type-1 domain-containing protein n=1 Tax=Fagus sylvatica TaxID=28930 RepID=A0A2N9H8G1_FAGSY